MNITVFGIGYVGLVQAAMLAHYGHKVICVDIDAKKIQNLLDGKVPIFEPGLDELITEGMSQNLLEFTTDSKYGVEQSDLIFIAVGTPSDKDGSADLRYVFSVAETITQYMQNSKLIVSKSTVPVGTGDKLRHLIQESLRSYEKNINFDVVSNPEFLREGSAVNDCLKPERIVIGASEKKSFEIIKQVYHTHINAGVPMVCMDIRSAELTKYVANSFLAMKISFMNEMANLAELLGADIDHVKQGISKDSRIGSAFINPGCGYGGSCFPKDTRALIKLAETVNYDAKILSAVNEVNVIQKDKLFSIVNNLFTDLNKRTFAIWGLSFKPNTDDVREASSLVLVENLIQHGATLRLYDPVANSEFHSFFGEHAAIHYCANKEDALQNADALIICTEWQDFLNPDFDLISKRLSTPTIIDGRNIYSPDLLQEKGINYYAIGRGLSIYYEPDDLL